MRFLLRHRRALCFSALACFLAMMALEFGYFRWLGKGATLDMRMLGFTPDQGMGWINALGREGGDTLLIWHYFSLDLLFPILLAAALASLILTAGRKVPAFSRLSQQAQTWLAIALVVPYALADYAQNIAISRLLANPLSANPASLSLASDLVQLKFLLGALPFLVLIGLRFAGRHAEPSRPAGGNS